MTRRPALFTSYRSRAVRKQIFLSRQGSGEGCAEATWWSPHKQPAPQRRRGGKSSFWRPGYQNPAAAADSTQRRICGSNPTSSIPAVQTARTAAAQLATLIGGTADISGVGFSMYIQRITVR